MLMFNIQLEPPTISICGNTYGRANSVIEYGMSGLFCIADLCCVGRKKNFLFFNFMIFDPIQAKMKKKNPIINAKTKVFF